MKKLISTLFLGITVTLVSCDTCTTCNYKTKDGKDIQEDFCGNSDETADFQKSIEDSAILHRSKYNCEENF